MDVTVTNVTSAKEGMAKIKEMLHTEIPKLTTEIVVETAKHANIDLTPPADHSQQWQSEQINILKEHGYKFERTHELPDIFIVTRKDDVLISGRIVRIDIQSNAVNIGIGVLKEN